jgi:hypothetical protein
MLFYKNNFSGKLFKAISSLDLNKYFIFIVFFLSCCFLVVGINSFEVDYTYKYAYYSNVEAKNSIVTNKTINLFDFYYEIDVDVFENDDRKVFLKLDVSLKCLCVVRNCYENSHFLKSLQNPMMILIKIQFYLNMKKTSLVLKRFFITNQSQLKR